MAQTRVVLDALEAKGLLRRPASAEEREGLVNEAAMTVASTVDETLRDLAVRRLAEFRPELGRALVGEAVDALLAPRRTRGRRPQADRRRARGR